MQNLKKQKGYTMGIDIGTSSVGCAVIDRGTFKVMRKGKHKLWSVRLFDEADSAEETRHYRSVRRGYDRRRKRIMTKIIVLYFFLVKKKQQLLNTIKSFQQSIIYDNIC